MSQSVQSVLRVLVGAPLVVAITLSCGCDPASLIYSDETPVTPQLEAPAGRWGRLTYSYRHIRIAPEDIPDSVIALGAAQPPVWSFPGQTRTDVAHTLVECGLTEEAVRDLLKDAAVSADGVTVRPEPGVVVSLPPTVRSALYKTLALLNPDGIYRHPLRFVDRDPDRFYDDAGLPPDSLSLVRKLMVHDPPLRYFADPYVAFHLSGYDDERKQLASFFTRQRHIDAEIQVPDAASFEAVVDYWGAGRSADVVRDLFQIANGGPVPLEKLLPEFARERLAQFEPEGIDVFKDCHWTTLNFFNVIPNDDYANTTNSQHVFQTLYRPIPEPSQLGDVVLFVTPDQQVVHSCVFLAGNLVFTRNGGDFRASWRILALQDVIDFYEPEGPFDVVYLRSIKAR